MRSRLAFGFVLLALVALCWLLIRTRERDARSAAPSVPIGDLAREAQGPEPARGLGIAEVTPSTMRQDSEGETRFEPLPEEPKEIVVHVVDSATDKPVLGAEIFVLEVDYRMWPLDLADDECVPGVEALLKQRGQRIESDEHGDIHLPVPRQWWAISARKDAQFGEESFGFDSLPESKLRIVPEHSCRVRTRDSLGQPAADTLVELRAPHTGKFWRGRTDMKGEALCPELGWLLECANSERHAWFATVSSACLEPPIRWFQEDEPLPETIALVLPDSQRLKLRVAASDGTLVPLGGSVSIEVRSAPGKPAAPPMWDETQVTLPLRRGEVLVPGAEPGARALVKVDLDGGEQFDQELLVPEAGGATTDITLRLPESLQVVLAHVTDDVGAPLAQTALEWNFFAQVQGDESEHTPDDAQVRTDEQGLLAFVISPEHPHSGERYDSLFEPGSVLMWRGYLRSRGAGRELVSAPILFAASGTRAVRDLGTLKLTPDAPLVRGRVTDEGGRPLALVHVGLKQVRMEDAYESLGDLAGVSDHDDARTDNEGHFVLYGTCPGGKLRLSLERSGYAMPLEATPVTFECGSSPELALVLVRSGAIRTSIQAGKGLDHELSWVLEDGGEEPSLALHPEDGGGLLERTFTALRPGSYRVRLEGEDSNAAPLLAVEHVIVRPGELTLDPRLLRIDASPLAGATGSAHVASDKPPIVLHVVDSQGKPVLDGRVDMREADVVSSAAWHGGRIVISWQEREETFTIWSPGFHAWSGGCPESSRDLRLDPALQLRVHVEIPRALQRPDWRFTVHLQDAYSGSDVENLFRRMGGAELDSKSIASFECPGACDVTLVLSGRALDASGAFIGAEVQLKTSSEMRVKLAEDPREQRFEIRASAEEWAALESQLRAQR